MRILIVDDDPDLLQGYGDFFEDAGHQTTRCGSFEDARAALRQHVFDAIVTDVRLDGNNGLGLLIDAEAFLPGLRKVVMSGFPDHVLRRDAEQLGAVYLGKPVDLDALLHAVDGDGHHPSARSETPAPPPR